MKHKSPSNKERFFQNCLLKTGIPILLFLLLSNSIYAQQEAAPGRIGIHAGLNSGLLSGGVGPSLSLHYAIRTEKVLQLESMLFLDSHSGKTFLSGFDQQNFGLGVAAGPRINVFPQKNWTRSFVVMPGIMYSSQKTSRHDDPGSSGLSGALCLGISNAFYQKHMASLGFNVGENIFAASLKYGYWF
jgi:hypothetical protein